MKGNRPINNTNPLAADIAMQIASYEAVHGKIETTPIQINRQVHLSNASLSMAEVNERRSVEKKAKPPAVKKQRAKVVRSEKPASFQASRKSRLAAKAAGKNIFTGNPCEYGHTERYVNSYACVCCAKNRKK